MQNKIFKWGMVILLLISLGLLVWSFVVGMPNTDQLKVLDDKISETGKLVEDAQATIEMTEADRLAVIDQINAEGAADAITAAQAGIAEADAAIEAAAGNKAKIANAEKAKSAQMSVINKYYNTAVLANSSIKGVENSLVTFIASQKDTTEAAALVAEAKAKMDANKINEKTAPAAVAEVIGSNIDATKEYLAQVEELNASFIQQKKDVQTPVNTLLAWTYIMIVIAIICVIIVGLIVSAGNNPKGLIKTGIVVVAIAVVCFIVYKIAPGTATDSLVEPVGDEAAMTSWHNSLKLTDTCLYLTYLAAALAIVSIIVGEIRLAISNKK